MNCDCIANTREAIKKHYVDKEISLIKIPTLTQVVNKNGTNDLVAKTFTEVKILFGSNKKPKSVEIAHSFCPFCGTKIDSE